MNQHSPEVRQTLEEPDFLSVHFITRTDGQTPIGAALGAVTEKISGLGPPCCWSLNMELSVQVSHYGRTAIEIVPQWELEPPGMIRQDLI